MFYSKCASNISDNAGAGVTTASPKPWMRIAACAVATIATIAIALFSLSGCGSSNTKASGSSGSSSSSSAEPVSTKSVDDYSWEELSEISEEISKEATEEDAIEVAKKYNLVNSDGELDGTQTKTVQLTDGTTATVQIAGFLHDDKADGGKAGVTFIFKDCIGEHDMNSSNTNAGGWEASQMRSYLNSDALSAPIRSTAEGRIGKQAHQQCWQNAGCVLGYQNGRSTMALLGC